MQVGLTVLMQGPPEPVPWSLTGTSSVAAPPLPAITHRVSPRLLRKDQRLAVRAGASYLSRGDLRSNPGVSLDLAWYPLEVLAIDAVSATLFFSELGSTAHRLRETTGLLPDSQKPLARVTTGARLSLAYGKLVFEPLDTVVHLDASTFLHGGVFITEDAANAAGDLGLALQVALGSRLLLWLEGSWVISYENRTDSSVASGPMGTIGFGLLLL